MLDVVQNNVIKRMARLVRREIERVVNHLLSDQTGSSSISMRNMWSKLGHVMCMNWVGGGPDMLVVCNDMILIAGR